MGFTYRPSEDAKKAIEELKRRRSFQANSKAINYALINIIPTEKERSEAHNKINELQNELREMKDIIKRKASSDKDFNEMVSKMLSPGRLPGA